MYNPFTLFYKDLHTLFIMTKEGFLIFPKEKHGKGAWKKTPNSKGGVFDEI